MDDIAFLSAVNLVKAILEKRISSSELLEIYIERYERFNPGVNAIVETDFETARTRARQADDALANDEILGPLHGTTESGYGLMTPFIRRILKSAIALKDW